MNQQTLDNQETISEKEIDLYDLVVALWKRRNVIILFSSIAAIISLMLALFWFSNVYTSTATLMPKTSSTSGVSLSRLGLPELGGLSNIIGASGSNDPNLNLAQKLITARGFIVDFVEKEDYLPEILVAEDWDPASNSLSIITSLSSSKGSNGPYVLMSDSLICIFNTFFIRSY